MAQKYLFRIGAYCQQLDCETCKLLDNLVVENKVKSDAWEKATAENIKDIMSLKERMKALTGIEPVYLVIPEASGVDILPPLHEGCDCTAVLLDEKLTQTVQAKYQPEPHLNWRQWHHGYLGAGLALASLLIILTCSRPWVDIAMVAGQAGTLLLLDDILQHWLQHHRPGYRSPVNRLWAWLVRLLGK